jgi:uncharacterized CHY-type Zn-finger protein
VIKPSWQIEHSCPQCGAPITLSETDHILDCPFCRTRLYLVPDFHFTYYLSPSTKIGPQEELLYIPYWRFKGSSFRIALSALTYRFLDTNIIALQDTVLRSSIGMRAQTLKLHFVTSNTKGHFIKPEFNLEQTLPRLVHNKQKTFHDTFIGEAISLIYSPLILSRKKLYDGILRKPLLTVKPDFIEKLLSQKNMLKAAIKFIPTICPYCGWDMKGEKGSLVMICKNCNSAWALKKDKFEQINAVTMIGHMIDEDTVYLPFWRIKAKFDGIDMSSYADLIKFANLPKAITKDIEISPLHFWSPAFKINPALYLRLCKQITLLRPYDNESQKLPQKHFYQATLPIGEAKEGILVNLAQIIANKERYYPKLKGLSVSIQDYRLEYHPFFNKGREFISSDMRIGISQTALDFGNML